LSRRVLAVRALLMCLITAVTAGSCAVDSELRPDEVLQAELGLTDRDRVHRVTILGGAREVATPAETTIAPGAYVEFVTSDWLVHEVRFELDSLDVDARAFLESTDQVASPPMLRLDSRYVLDFEDGPPGRYPYILEGNGAPGRGVVVVKITP